MTWLIATKTGRTILAALVLAIIVLLCWWGFSSHYTEVGRKACEAEHEKAAHAADVRQEATNSSNDKTSAAVGQKTADEVAATVAKADENAAANKKDIRNAYKKPVTTAPIALGSCVHPVPDSVQDAIESAAKRARKTP